MQHVFHESSSEVELSTNAAPFGEMLTFSTPKQKTLYYEQMSTTILKSLHLKNTSTSVSSNTNLVPLVIFRKGEEFISISDNFYTKISLIMSFFSMLSTKHIFKNKYINYDI